MITIEKLEKQRCPTCNELTDLAVFEIEGITKCAWCCIECKLLLKVIE